MFELFVNSDLIRRQMHDQFAMQSHVTRTPGRPRQRSLFRGRRLAKAFARARHSAPIFDEPR